MDLMKWKDRQSPEAWNNLRSLQKEINSLFNDDFFPASTGLFDRTYSPAVDMVENNDDFLVTCELPGFSIDDIDVQVANNVLTIKGDKKESTEDEKKRWYKKETWSGSFQRTLTLPAGVNTEKNSG
jgi:HSP20 family protein